MEEDDTDKEAKRAPVAIRWWILIIVQINYLATRKFYFAFPLSILYEILTTIILKSHNFHHKSYLFMRIVVIAIVLTFDILLQYAYDLTYFAGAAYLFLWLVWLLTLACFGIIPLISSVYHIKYGLFVVYSGLLIGLISSMIFAEPWIYLALFLNTITVFVMILLIDFKVIHEHMGIVLYIYAAFLVIFIYRYGVGIKNSEHHISHYF